MPPQAAAVAIRKAKSEDSPGILACLREAFEEFREGYSPESFLDTVLTRHDRRGRGQFRGRASSGMAVLPAMRGSGIAAQLLEQAEAELGRFRCARVTLDATEPLLRAMRFYEKHGYRRSGKTKGLYGMLLIEYQKTLF